MPLNKTKVGFANPLNRVFIGDNLPALRALHRERGECADLVYLDPPFNSKADYNFVFGKDKSTTQAQTAFTDIWKCTGQTRAEMREFIASDFCPDAAARYLKGLRMMCGETGEGGARLAYMTHIVPRLCAIRAVMKPTATIYLHCDQTASHYAKLAMDAVFGPGNFVNEIVWLYRKWTNAANCFQRNHDTLLAYGAGGARTFNKAFDKKAPQSAKFRRGWDVNRVGGIRQLIVYDREKAAKKIAEGRHDRIVYRESPGGVALPDWWEIPILNSQSRERIGYPTQKPVALLERIVRASSNPGDVVLDPYCGCGTTVAACLKAKRQFIGMDLEGFAAQVMRARMHDQHDYELELGFPKPRTLADFDSLAENRAMLYYEHYAIELIPGAMPATTDTKRQWTEATAAIGVGDKGIDGILPVICDGGRKNIVISVKAGKSPTTSWIRDLRGVIERDRKFGAMGGILVTRFAPTDGMKREARTAGTFTHGGWEHDRIRLLTVKELMDARVRAQSAYDRHKANREVGGVVRMKADFLLAELGLPEGLVDFNARAPKQGTLSGLE